MKTRKTQYFDTIRGWSVYGFEYNDGSDWKHYYINNTFTVFDTEAERDQALKQFKTKHKKQNQKNFLVFATNGKPEGGWSDFVEACPTLNDAIAVAVGYRSAEIVDITKLKVVWSCGGRD